MQVLESLVCVLIFTFLLSAGAKSVEEILNIHKSFLSMSTQIIEVLVENKKSASSFSSQTLKARHMRSYNFKQGSSLKYRFPLRGLDQ